MIDPSFELTSAVRLDLLQIWNHLAEEASTEAADTVLADLERAIEFLAEFPAAGLWFARLVRCRGPVQSLTI